jgi:hypothetical protein
MAHAEMNALAGPSWRWREAGEPGPRADKTSSSKILS